MNELVMKYFVLSPLKNDAFGLASRKAIIAFANEIEEDNMELAVDLRKWIADLNEKDKPDFEEVKPKVNQEEVEVYWTWWNKLDITEKLTFIDKYFKGKSMVDITLPNIHQMYNEER